ncbi:HD domain-containing protein [Melittangium boletus]|uniref:HD domain-containing protein n=1 Tax=Melittangium boletus TaxID=83453 RepID=UPI003DA57358
MKDTAQGVNVVPGRLAGLRPLVGELMDLKRVRTPDQPEGLAAHGFRRAWAALVSGVHPDTLALREAALALTGIRLGGIDLDVLSRAGMPHERAVKVLRRGLDAAAEPLDRELRERLHTALAGLPVPGALQPPAFVERLVRQPRAGPTRAHTPRVVLLPAESHADHCYVVAVASVLVSPLFGADPAIPFVAALSHHFFNVVLPDAGDYGDRLLGEDAAPLMARVTEDVLATLPEGLAALVREARKILPHTDSPEARAFHAADAMDRVLEMDAHARAAGFTLRQAMVDLELIHEGPMQAYENAVLTAAGLIH